MASIQELEWVLDEDHDFGGEKYTIQSLRDLLDSADTMEEEYKSMINNLHQAKKRIMNELVIRTDADPMAISTPQAIAWNEKTKNKMLDLQSIQLRRLFFDFAIPVSEEVRKEVRGYMHRTFPTVSAWAIDRAVLANRGHLAGAHIMIEAWLKAGSPEKFEYRVMGSVRNMIYRMSWPYEKHIHDYSTTKRRSENLTPSRKSEMSLPLSPSMLIELQYLQAREEWLKARREERSRAGLDASGSFQDLDKSFVASLQKEMKNEMKEDQLNDNKEEVSQDIELNRKLEEDFNEAQLSEYSHDLSDANDLEAAKEIVEECPDQSGLFVPKGESTMKSFESPLSDQKKTEDQDSSATEEAEDGNDIGFMMKSSEETDLPSFGENAVCPEVLQDELLHLLADAATPLESVLESGALTEQVDTDNLDSADEYFEENDDAEDSEDDNTEDFQDDENFEEEDNAEDF